jgi:hypothetical protein
MAVGAVAHLVSDHDRLQTSDFFTVNLDHKLILAGSQIREAITSAARNGLATDLSIRHATQYQGDLLWHYGIVLTSDTNVAEERLSTLGQYCYGKQACGSGNGEQREELNTLSGHDGSPNKKSGFHFRGSPIQVDGNEN